MIGAQVPERFDQRRAHRDRRRARRLFHGTGLAFVAVLAIDETSGAVAHGDHARACVPQQMGRAFDGVDMGIPLELLQIQCTADVVAGDQQRHIVGQPLPELPVVASVGGPQQADPRG